MIARHIPMQNEVLPKDYDHPKTSDLTSLYKMFHIENTR